MIDTLKLLIPIADSKFLEQIKTRLVRTRRENLETSELKFEYFTGEVEVGSYSRNVNIYLTESSPVGFFVEFSLPKQYHNNNVEMVYPFDITFILNSFRNQLCKHLKATLPLLSEWIVYRLDVCYNWTFESEQKCQSFMNFIQRIDFPRKKKYVYDTSVMYKGTAYTIKFYLKGAEFKRNDFKVIRDIDEDKAFKLLAWSEKVLRFEVEFKKVYLKTLFGKEKVLVSDVADNLEIEQILQHYLASVFRYVDKENMKHENVRQLINENYKPAKALRLYQFFKGFFFEPDEKFQIKKGLNASTIWRYKKDLKKIGVSFEENLGDSNFVAVEELVVPSPRGKFDLLDYQLTSDYS
jgi:II/X family phage/plasmid replication protein